MLAAGTASALPIFSNIYVLGDSLSDQGNLFDATLALRGAGIPASDHYVDGRFSNGEVYSGLLARRLGLTLNSTSRGGNNFAYGGTRTDYNIVEAAKPGSSFDPGDPGGLAAGSYAWTLDLQRQAFVSRGISDPAALYVVFSGSNDIGDLLQGRAPGGSAERSSPMRSRPSTTSSPPSRTPAHGTCSFRTFRPGCRSFRRCQRAACGSGGTALSAASTPPCMPS